MTNVEFDPFADDANAAQTFGRGLQIVKHGPPYNEAIMQFADGLVELGVPADFIYGEGIPSELPENCMRLPVSAGLRDLGFTHVRDALATPDEIRALEKLEHAAQLLKCADHIPRILLERLDPGRPRLGLDPATHSVAYGGVVRALELRAMSAERVRFGSRTVFWRFGWGGGFEWMGAMTDNELFQAVDHELKVSCKITAPSNSTGTSVSVLFG